MRFTSVSSKGLAEAMIIIQAPDAVREEVLRETVKGIQKMNRRRERCGGKRIGYRVELISSSSS